MRFLLPLTITAALGAQAALGKPAPALQVAEWLHGAAPAAAQPCAIAFGAPLPKDVAFLRVLQRRHPAIRVVVIAEAAAALPPELPFAVARDDQGATARAFGAQAADREQTTLWLMDRGGLLAWRETPSAALDPILDSLARDRFDLHYERLLRELGSKITAATGPAGEGRLEQYAERLIAMSVARSEGWLLKSDLARAQPGAGDALACARDAVRALRHDAVELLHFVRTALLTVESGEPAAAELRQLAVRTLADEANRKGATLELQIALVAAHALAGQQAAARTVADRLTGLEPEARAALAAALALGQPPDPRVAPSELQQIAGWGGDGLALLRARQVHALVVRLHAFDSADRVGRSLLPLQSRSSGWLNSFAWYLDLEPLGQGRLASLALAAAEVMSRAPGGDDFACTDTLAQAKFEYGLVDEAIALQTKAIELGGRTDPDYQRRLERYRRARSAR